MILLSLSIVLFGALLVIESEDPATGRGDIHVVRSSHIRRRPHLPVDHVASNAYTLLLYDVRRTLGIISTHYSDLV